VFNTQTAQWKRQGKIEGMKDIINGKNLDSILEYCFKKFKKDINSATFLHDLLDEEEFSCFSEGEIKIMIEYINNYEYEVLGIDIGYNSSIIGDEVTGIFLNNGGFTKILNEEENNNDYLKEKEILSNKVLEFQVEEFKYKETIRDLKEELMISSLLKNYWYLIGSAIALGIAIGGYLF
jgi:hypothetical protein